MSLTIKKENGANGNGASVTAHRASSSTSGLKDLLLALRNSVDELGEGMLQILSGIVPYVPRVQVQHGEEAIEVSVPLPGVDERSLDVALEGQSLRIRGTRSTEHEKTRRNYHRVERVYRVFERSVPISAEIDHAKIAATMRDGVLRVHLPRLGATRTVVVQHVHVTSDVAQA